jgi:flagellar protein FlbT
VFSPCSADALKTSIGKFCIQKEKNAMALKVELKPNERIIIGNVVVRNDEHRVRFFIEGHTPILREKDILTAETADSPAKKIYLAIQLMYLAADPSPHYDVYFKLIREFINAAPSSMPLISEINNLILNGQLYKALKASRKLIDYEADLINHALRG